MVVPDGAGPGRVQVLFAAAGAARAVVAGIRRRPPGGSAVWERRNHAGRPVDLYAGPAAVLGTALAAATAPGLPPRVRRAAGLAVLAAGACGAYDDVVGRNDARRGVRAHLSALRRGEITSGAVQLLGTGAAGLAAGVLLGRRPVDALLAGAVVAGSAHVVDLLDVRPGRAAKAVLAAGAPALLRGGAPGALCAAPMGAAAALLADDLDERSMLGDAGAHALGAGLGVAVAASAGRGGLVLATALLLAAAAAGDRVGDGPAWLDRPVLRVWDALGRRPAPVSVYSRGATPARVTGGRRV
ncbi:hypothetical protein [Streptomyces zingiberis]|uniref:hypothetical protein n=1 Tax=Streptomyces zingiberis TaxID=2053010 RepID=UPI001F0E169A|nr:hypothetical protein [Streptomyces zingiberis]